MSLSWIAEAQGDSDAIRLLDYMIAIAEQPNVRETLRSAQKAIRYGYLLRESSFRCGYDFDRMPVLTSKIQ